MLGNSSLLTRNKLHYPAQEIQLEGSCPPRITPYNLPKCLAVQLENA